MAVIGVIGSIGVSINAAIIILTALQKNAGAMAGDRAAIAATVLAQSRHIVSTTVTTFGGFIPLILAGGGFWPPFKEACPTGKRHTVTFKNKCDRAVTMVEVAGGYS